MTELLTPVDIAKQIQSNTKIFKLVGLTSELSRILDEEPTYKPQLPACMVMFSGSHMSENTALTGFYGTEDIEIDIFIVLDNSTDFTGSKGMQVNRCSCVQDIRSSILGWIPNDRITTPIAELGTEFIMMSASRIIYKMTYSIEQQITPEDGYQQPTENLQEVDMTFKYKDTNVITSVSKNT